MKVLIAAGATKEYIDAIRFISNDSSGKTGLALLKECLKRKYIVKFIYGSGKALNERAIAKISKDNAVKLIHAISYADFKNNILKEVSDCEVFICPAAISDFTVVSEDTKNLKIKSDHEILIRLVPTEKIVKLVKEKFPKIFVVAFKAEYNVSEEELKKAGIEKLEKENLDLVVANDVSKSKFGENKADVFLISKDESEQNKRIKIVHLKSNKKEIAKRILDFIESKIRNFTKF